MSNIKQRLHLQISLPERTLVASALVTNSTTVRTRRASAFRGDLEGLRAVAVLAVVAHHLFHAPSGGYAGVDVFFVLSGYLITGILLRELNLHGRISFSDFYRRRARRILPAAVLVLVATTVSTFVVFRSGRAVGVLGDAYWASVFLGNWHSALNGTDYMNAGSAASPLQHYWSLGVEEQFYVLWPILILVLVRSGRRAAVSARGERALLGAGIAAPVLASYAFAYWETTAHPTVAYFSTFTRAWELGAGSLVAVCAPLFGSLSRRVRALLAWSGLAAIIVSFFVLDPASAFPAPGAILPVLGSLAVVVAGIDPPRFGPSERLFPLTNPVSRYIGKISFSLYLWHFPVAMLLQPLFAPGDKTYYPVAIAAIALFSVGSFHLIEDPIRRSRWLERRTLPAGRRFRAASGGVALKWMGGAAAVAMLGVAASILQLPLAPASVGAKAAQGSSSRPVVEVPAADPAASRSLAVKAALDAPAWPNLDPDLDQLGGAGARVKAPEWTEDGCLGTNEAQLEDPIANAEHCVYGDSSGPHTLVVYGDSVAISYLPGIRAALAGHGWKVYVLAVAGCPVADVRQTMIGGAPFPQCDAFRRWAIQRIGELKPDLVVATEFRNDAVLLSGAVGADADRERAAGLASALPRIAAGAGKVLYVSAPPQGKLLESCATRFSTPADCTASASAFYRRTVGIERAAVAGLGPRGSYVDTEPWFCVEGRCPAFVGHAPLRADEYHLTAAASRDLAPLLKAAIVAAIGPGS